MPVASHDLCSYRMLATGYWVLIWLLSARA